MRRRKSILPALIIEAIAVLGLAGLYFSMHPFNNDGVVERELPQVEYLADDVESIPRTAGQFEAPPTMPSSVDGRMSVSQRPLPGGFIHMN